MARTGPGIEMSRYHLVVPENEYSKNKQTKNLYLWGYVKGTWSQLKEFSMAKAGTI